MKVLLEQFHKLDNRFQQYNRQLAILMRKNENGNFNKKCKNKNFWGKKSCFIKIFVQQFCRCKYKYRSRRLFSQISEISTTNILKNGIDENNIENPLK